MSKNLDRKTQIENFCTDLKIIWSSQYPELTFADIVGGLEARGIEFKTDAEILDELMDLCD